MKPNLRLTTNMAIAVLAVETSLGTNFLLSVSQTLTFLELRGQMEMDHFTCFPAHGKISIDSLMVYYDGKLYHVMDTMHIGHLAWVGWIKLCVKVSVKTPKILCSPGDFETGVCKDTVNEVDATAKDHYLFEKWYRGNAENLLYKVFAGKAPYTQSFLESDAKRVDTLSNEVFSCVKDTEREQKNREPSRSVVETIHLFLTEDGHKPGDTQERNAKCGSIEEHSGVLEREGQKIGNKDLEDEISMDTKLVNVEVELGSNGDGLFGQATRMLLEGSLASKDRVGEEVAMNNHTDTEKIADKLNVEDGHPLLPASMSIDVIPETQESQIVTQLYELLKAEESTDIGKNKEECGGTINIIVKSKWSEIENPHEETHMEKPPGNQLPASCDGQKDPSDKFSRKKKKSKKGKSFENIIVHSDRGRGGTVDCDSPGNNMLPNEDGAMKILLEAASADFCNLQGPDVPRDVLKVNKMNTLIPSSDMVEKEDNVTTSNQKPMEKDNPLLQALDGSPVNGGSEESQKKKKKRKKRKIRFEEDNELIDGEMAGGGQVTTVQKDVSGDDMADHAQVIPTGKEFDAVKLTDLSEDDMGDRAQVIPTGREFDAIKVTERPKKRKKKHKKYRKILTAVAIESTQNVGECIEPTMDNRLNDSSGHTFTTANKGKEMDASPHHIVINSNMAVDTQNGGLAVFEFDSNDTTNYEMFFTPVKIVKQAVNTEVSMSALQVVEDMEVGTAQRKASRKCVNPKRWSTVLSERLIQSQTSRRKKVKGKYLTLDKPIDTGSSNVPKSAPEPEAEAFV